MRKTLGMKPDFSCTVSMRVRMSGGMSARLGMGVRAMGCMGRSSLMTDWGERIPPKPLFFYFYQWGGCAEGTASAMVD